MDLGSIARKAQDALTDGTAEKALREGAGKVEAAMEGLLRDNAPRIDSAVGTVAGFAKDRLPGHEQQVDRVVSAIHGIVHGGSTPGATDAGTDVPAAPTAPVDTDVPASATAPPGDVDASPTPEVDRVAEAQDDRP